MALHRATKIEDNIGRKFSGGEIVGVFYGLMSNELMYKCKCGSLSYVTLEKLETMTDNSIRCNTD